MRPLFLAITCLFANASFCPAEEKPIKVFILAGQSNMEGKAPNSLLEHQARDPLTKEAFAHLRKDDQWIVRDDVFIKFLDRKGPLTIGYGSPDRTGAELEFGMAMGDHFDEPVILIKAAWGGHSLYRKFRSPSAGFPEAMMEKELKQAQAEVKKNNEREGKNDPLPTLEEIKSDYGSSYREMMTEVKEVLGNHAALFPELSKERPLEIAGFVWFQGWNDQYGAEEEYASNLQHFINDVRKDLNSPKLPFVIAAMGQNGSKPAEGAMLTVQSAQLSMNDIPEFAGNVKAFRTDVLIDKRAEEMYPRWKELGDEWNKIGGDHPYHYLGSAIWFNRIGKAMGEEMLGLMGGR